MNKKELIEQLEPLDDESEVILVIYTENSYVSGYVERIDPHTKYNSVTGKRLDDDESVVELTNSLDVK